MRRLNYLFVMTLLLATTALVVCAADEAPSTQPQTFTGVLRQASAERDGGFDASAGYWVLQGDGATGGIAVDISAVKDEAKKLEGKRVKIEGKMAAGSGKGDKPVLAAEKVAAAPEKQKDAAK